MFGANTALGTHKISPASVRVVSILHIEIGITGSDKDFWFTDILSEPPPES